MMTREEGAKLKAMKLLVLAGGQGAVLTEDKQWVLDLLKREGVAVREVVKTAAKNSGFDVTGIVTLKK